MIFSAHFRSFVRKHWLAVGCFVLFSLAALWFAFVFISDFLYFNDPRNQDAQLKGWMTPRYVVMTYDLPRPLVADILGLTSMDQRGMPMRDIAAEMGVTLEELTEIVRAAAADHRANAQ